MRRFLFLLVFGIVGGGLLLSLGTWQLRRLAWKQGVLAEIETRIAADPVALPAAPDPERDRYLPVRVAGTMGAQELHVLVSTRDFGAGYRIITPFVTDSGRRILIDRGFIPTEAKTAVRQTGAMEITGNLHWPQEIDSFTPAPEPDKNIWFAREVPTLAAALDTEPVLLIARSQTDPNVVPLPVTSVGIPNDHLQYAVTWFGLALVWILMTLYFLWRTRARSRS
ncbi:SURF1 family protein [Antarcticimicrobium sediminis]|uniref:SURF1-like protein n=1 Tax=Antarcticimicrobium sediminis TaxID=2546227 RepID=A0A4V2Z8B2_9RHOB|nr:SURF1 family protein [Antarcticimicrobium sediminis]TDE39676.1 SURF1 family protein [Antarcticimicrobium sediminis]